VKTVKLTTCSSEKGETDILGICNGVKESSVSVIVERLKRLIVEGKDESSLYNPSSVHDRSRWEKSQPYIVTGRGLRTDSPRDRKGEESGIDPVEVAVNRRESATIQKERQCEKESSHVEVSSSLVCSEREPEGIPTEGGSESVELRE